MEWGWFPLYFTEDPDEVALTEKMIDSLLAHGFQPQNLKGQPLQRKFWKSSDHWTQNIIWVNQNYV